MRPTVLLLAFLAVGCAKVEPDPAMALTCQLKYCTCVLIDSPPFVTPDTTEVSFGQNGRAACPEGYMLHLATESGRPITTKPL